MRKYLKHVGIAAFCLTLTGCGGCTRVTPGYVGVKSTLAGSNRGLGDVIVGPAWAWYNPFTASVIEYPVFVQTGVWTASKDEGHPVNEEITFTTKQSLSVAADVSIGYSLQPDKVPDFYLKYRVDELDKFTHGFLRNLAREEFDNAAGKYDVEEVMGDNSKFLKEVRDALQKRMDPVGIKIEQFGFIGSPRPPQSVIGAINAKVQATQLAIQKQNEVVQATADARKQVEQAKGNAESRREEAKGTAEAIMTEASAQAKANRILSESLTPNLIEHERIMKWNGELPQVTGGSTPMIDLRSK